MKLALVAALLLVSVSFANAQEGKTCLKAEGVIAALAAAHQQPRRLEGDALAMFNEAYTKKFNHPAPEGVDLVVMVERGEMTLVMSFTNGCVSGQGHAQTALIHELLGG